MGIALTSSLSSTVTDGRDEATSVGEAVAVGVAMASVLDEEHSGASLLSSHIKVPASIPLQTWS